MPSKQTEVTVADEFENFASALGTEPLIPVLRNGSFFNATHNPLGPVSVPLRTSLVRGKREGHRYAFSTANIKNFSRRKHGLARPLPYKKALKSPGIERPFGGPSSF